MRNQAICDKCNVRVYCYSGIPNGWEIIEDRDLCSKCLRLYNRTWKKKIKKVEDKYQAEINTLCKDRDDVVEIMFKTFLKPK